MSAHSFQDNYIFENFVGEEILKDLKGIDGGDVEHSCYTRHIQYSILGTVPLPDLELCLCKLHTFSTCVVKQ